jgi:hypothetical protein
VKRTLAEGSMTRLEICGCNSFYLTIGPLTVCLHPSAIEELHDTLGRAVAALRSEAAASAPHHSQQRPALPVGAEEGEPDQRTAGPTEPVTKPN